MQNAAKLQNINRLLHKIVFNCGLDGRRGTRITRNAGDMISL